VGVAQDSGADAMIHDVISSPACAVCFSLLIVVVLVLCACMRSSQVSEAEERQGR
jgi:hypothetical protein